MFFGIFSWPPKNIFFGPCPSVSFFSPASYLPARRFITRIQRFQQFKSRFWDFSIFDQTFLIFRFFDFFRFFRFFDFFHFFDFFDFQFSKNQKNLKDFWKCSGKYASQKYFLKKKRKYFSEKIFFPCPPKIFFSSCPSFSQRLEQALRCILMKLLTKNDFLE